MISHRKRAPLEGEPAMRNKPQMALEDAYKIAEAVRAAAAKRDGHAATIAIVDSGGHLLYLERPDRQSPNSVEIATLKARTAAFRERPSFLNGSRMFVRRNAGHYFGSAQERAAVG